MSPTVLRTAFGMATLCVFGAVVLLLLEPHGSGPFWITVWTLIIAILFLASVIAVIRFALRDTRKGGDVSSNEAHVSPFKPEHSGGSPKSRKS